MQPLAAGIWKSAKGACLLQIDPNCFLFVVVTEGKMIYSKRPLRTNFYESHTRFTQSVSQSGCAGVGGKGVFSKFARETHFDFLPAPSPFYS